MASYEKLKNGKGWRVHIERQGIRKSQTFPNKAEAVSWAAVEEASILAGKRGDFPKMTLLQAFNKYELEVSSKKKGRRPEVLRFKALAREFPELAGKLLTEVTTADLVAWRDARLKTVSASSVRREAAQIRAVWTVASKEWLWCPEATPWSKMKLPRKAHARTRRYKWQEVRWLLRSCGYVTGQPPKTPQQEVAYTVLLALHTAMRSGELLSLSTETVDLKKRLVRLEGHKTDEIVGVRFVPVFRRTVKLLRVLDEAARAEKRTKYLEISDQSRDTLFRKVRDRLLIKGMRFHDTRGDALTRMARRVDVMTLAKISGHKDLNQLLEAYYRETPEEIASRL